MLISTRYEEHTQHSNYNTFMSYTQSRPVQQAVQMVAWGPALSEGPHGR